MVKALFSVISFSLVVGWVALGATHGCKRRDDGAFRIGVTSGPHAQIMEVAAAEARQRGVQVQVVEFSDYVQPNAALADGSLDANSFQHLPYLEQQRRDHGYRFEAVGETVTFPIAAYSARHASLDALPTGAVIALPNDPTNGARALALLEVAGQVRLRKTERALATPRDVEWSRGANSVRELDAAQLARALPDVDLAVINTNYALEAGLDPLQGLVRESAQSPYANVIAVRRPRVRRSHVQGRRRSGLLR